MVLQFLRAGLHRGVRHPSRRADLLRDDARANACSDRGSVLRLRGARPHGPCRDLQRGGFDIQMTGFGNMSTYHADNEYCKLSDQEKGFAILKGVIANLE